MTAIQVDPRTVADALHIGVDDLAKLLAEWGAERLNDTAAGMDFERRTGAVTLEEFDEGVARARRFFADAHAAYREYAKDAFPAPGTVLHLVVAGDNDDVRGDAVTVVSVDALTGFLTVQHGDETIDIDNWFFPESEED